MTDARKSQLFVFGQFALLVLLLVWPDDSVGWGLLDFLFEFCGVIFVVIGMSLIVLSIRSVLVFSVPKITGTPKEKLFKLIGLVFPQPTADAKLVQTGLYKRMRHPMYSGVIWLGYGIGIASGPVPHLFFAIGLHVLLYYKSVLEEKYLSAKFFEYRYYIKKTGRFFPKVED